MIINGRPLLSAWTDFVASIACFRDLKIQLFFRCNVHGETKTHVCTDCAKPFATNADLQRHIRSKQKTHQCVCDICGMSFAEKANLKSHMDSHSGAANHKCNKCGKIFRHRSSLSKHKKAKHM